MKTSYYTSALMQHSRPHYHPFLFLLPLAVAAVLLVGCAQEIRIVGGEEGVPFEEVEIPFSGESKKGDIEGDGYRYFKYESPEDALIDRMKVSSDGKEIDGIRYEWSSPIHFFHYKKSIVIYLGENERTLGGIQRTFGVQFAGD